MLPARLLWLALIAPALAAAAERPPTPVEVAAPRSAPATMSVSAVGSLRADEQVAVRSEVAGIVRAIRFAEGQPIAAGALLVELDDEAPKAQLARSEASAQLARLNFDRARDMRGRNLNSQQDFDEASARLQEAKAQVAIDRINLARTRIGAPFAGIAGLREISVGSYLKAGDPVVTVSVTSPLRLDFRIAERYAGNVRADQPVAVQVAAFPGTTFAGAVYAVDPVVDERARALLVRARVANDDGRLNPGMFARVELTLGERPAALWIPEAAILPRTDSSLVYRVVDGRATATPVTLGLRRPGEVEVMAGVAAGDLVVTAGHQKIGDGAPVQPLGQDGTPP